MTKVHYFQRYHQKENVATNNTLLLFQRLNHYNPILFEIFLNTLCDTPDKLAIGPQLSQQLKSGKGGIPDGSIHQNSFRVLIETKLHEGITKSQILGHLKHFGNEEIQVMMTISPRQLESKNEAKIRNVVKVYNGTEGRQIKLLPATFQGIIDSFMEVIDYNRDFEMKELIDDYSEYCDSSGLLPDDRFKLRAIVAGGSFDECINNNIYYCPESRGFQGHSYIGLYNLKSVRAIGKIENIVQADWDEKTKKLTIHSKEESVTQEQKDRIISVVREAEKHEDWGVDKGHRFFLVEQFFETDFKKLSPRGLWGTRYFKLTDYLSPDQYDDKGVNVTPQEIAEILRDKDWS